MSGRNQEWRRTRVERGIYPQPNGTYTLCVMIDGKPRFRAVDARTIEEARRQRELLHSAARAISCPLRRS
jgi:hypothetical protein